MTDHAPEYNHDHENDIIFFGRTNFRNQLRKFGIKTDDRRRHMYLIGKPAGKPLYWKTWF